MTDDELQRIGQVAGFRAMREADEARQNAERLAAWQERMNAHKAAYRHDDTPAGAIILPFTLHRRHIMAQRRFARLGGAVAEVL